MASVGSPRMITQSQVVAALSYSELIPLVERGLGAFSKRMDEDRGGEGGGGGGGGGVFPQRTLMKIAEHDGCVYVMPVYSCVDDIIATKVVTNYPRNGELYNISSHMSTVILNDSKTGELKAIIDGEHLTGMRTAAASAIATKYLAKEGSTVLAILGAGTQAGAHIQALRHTMKPNEIRVWTRTFEKAQTLAKRFDITACKTAEEAVRGADVIAACTSSETPVLEASWLKPGVHINGVGACAPWLQELGSEVMRKAVVYADTAPGAKTESGDVIHSKVEIFGEIGDVINGTVEAKKDEITIFVSQGVAVEDATAAKLVYDRVMAGTSG